MVSVSSSARLFGAPVDPADPHMAQGYSPWRAYFRSKLANAHFALELDARARAAGLSLSVLAADPGFAATDLQAASAQSTGGRTERLVHQVVRLVGATPLRGALPQLRAATDPAAPSGSLYGLRCVAFGAPVRIPRTARELDQAARHSLWDISEELTGIRFQVGPDARPTEGSIPGPQASS